MADFQIYALANKATPLLTDKLPIQDAAGAAIAKQISLAQVKALLMPFKEYNCLLTINSGTFTLTTLSNDFTGVTFTGSNVSNGLISITASAAIFTANKTQIAQNVANNSGTLYALILSPFTNTSNVLIDIIQCSNNSQAGTPNITTHPVTIRVYN